MRWLCDEMLGGLARLLRAAGHDALLAVPGTPDLNLRQSAERDGRILLTRDRRLAAAPIAMLVEGDTADQQARSLTRSAAVDWATAPFSRCLVDNATLRPAVGDEIAAMPERARALGGPFNACPACGRIYWPGSHVRRLQEKLAELAREARAGCLEPAPAPGEDRPR